MHDIVGRDLVAAPARTAWQRLRRPAMMLLVPLLIVGVIAFFWLTGGKSVSTDNAYVAQDKVSISSDVTGRVVAVDVRESQSVRRGQVLFTIDAEPFRITLAQAEANLATARAQVAGLRQTFAGKGADVAGKREAIAYDAIDLKRQQDLMRDGFTTRARLQQAEHTLAQARSDLNAAQADEASAAAALRARRAARSTAIRWCWRRRRRATRRRLTCGGRRCAPPPTGLRARRPRSSPARSSRSASRR